MRETSFIIALFGREKARSFAKRTREGELGSLVSNLVSYGADLTPYSRFWAPRIKNMKQALSAAKRAVELDASKAESWHELAFVLWKEEDFDGAIKAEEEAVKLVNSTLKSTCQRQLDSIKKAKAEKK